MANTRIQQISGFLTKNRLEVHKDDLNFDALLGDSSRGNLSVTKEPKMVLECQISKKVSSKFTNVGGERCGFP